METAGHAVMASGVTVAISLLALLVLPGARPAQHGPRGHADPAGQRGGGAHPAPRAALQRRPAHRLPPHPQGRNRLPRLVGMGPPHRQAPPRRRRGGRGRARRSSSPRCSASRSGQGRAWSPWRRTVPGSTRCTTLTDGGVGAGVLTPIEVLVPADDAEAAADAARGVDGVQMAVVGTNRGDSAVVDVFPTQATLDSDASKVVTDVRAAVEPVVERRRRDHRSRSDHRGLLQRGLRQVPLRAGADRPDHLRPAGPHVPIRAAAAQGRAGQPDLAGAPCSARSCSSGSSATAPTRSSTSLRPERSTSGCPSSSSRSCSGCRWTTRSSSSPGCARSTTAPATPAWRSSPGSAGPDGWSPPRP